MPPKPRGQLRFKDGVWQARVRFVDGSRRWLTIGTLSLSRERAQKKTEETARKARTMEPPPSPHRRRHVRAGGESFANYVERWLKDRVRRGIQSAHDDAYRLNKHVIPSLGTLPIDGVDAADIEAIRDTLDSAIIDGVMSAKNAQNIWGCISKLFKDSVSSKNKELRVRKDNPVLLVQAPERHARREKQFLYPSEFSALVECTRVPRWWRRIYALSVYLYTRAGELEVLRCEDIDLVHNTVYIARARQSDATVGPTKTGATRRIPIEPAVRPLIEAMVREAKHGVLTKVPRRNDRSEVFREYLFKAGVRRAALHDEADASRLPITFHDLRATGLTWLAVRGDDHLKIKQRAGHRLFATTERYIREAENVREGFGDVFPVLPGSLL